MGGFSVFFIISALSFKFVHFLQ